ncbi:MAG: BON domain-containing protein [Methylococcales bacterium]|nr:BON domain-containing protein [Methylococcales bacterium]
MRYRTEGVRLTLYSDLLEVQLSGFVNSSADIAKAVAVANGVGGVKSVKNDMRLK